MYVRVTVIPAQKREKVVKKDDNRLEVCVREKAENNQANKRVIEIVASEFGVRIQDVRLIHGHHHSHKLFSLSDRI